LGLLISFYFCVENKIEQTTYHLTKVFRTLQTNLPRLRGRLVIFVKKAFKAFNSFLRYFPVRLFLFAAMSLGEPVATICPPSLPPFGPKSMI